MQELPCAGSEHPQLSFISGPSYFLFVTCNTYLNFSNVVYTF